MSAMPPPIEVVKNMLKAGWEMGDFGAFSSYTAAGDKKISRQVQVHPGERVLDAACGAGVLALRLAQAGAIVTGIDIATNLVEQARSRARSAGLAVQFDEGDVEALPYPDASFDAVMSQFGVMFAARPPVVLQEIARVLAPGGRVILFSWTPASWVSQLGRVVARHAPPPPNAPMPPAWGDEATARERLAPAFDEVKISRDTYRLAFPFGPNLALDFFLQNMGPVRQAYAFLKTPEKQQALRDDLEQFFQKTNQGKPEAFQVDSEYLLVEARKRG